MGRTSPSLATPKPNTLERLYHYKYTYFPYYLLCLHFIWNDLHCDCSHILTKRREKAVFHISINKPRKSLVDIIHLDNLNRLIDFVLCTKVDHFLDVFCTPNNTTRQGPPTYKKKFRLNLNDFASVTTFIYFHYTSVRTENYQDWGLQDAFSSHLESTLLSSHHQT